MAAVAGLSPAQLEAAGRADAAAALADALAADPSETIRRRIMEMSSDQARQLLATIAIQVGITLADQDDLGSGASAGPGLAPRQGS